MGESKGAVMVRPDPWFNAVSQDIKYFKPGIAFDDSQVTSETYAEDYKKDASDGGTGAGTITAKALSEVRGIDFTVGRPTNGIMAKPNTHAYVQVLGPDGKTIKCFNNIGVNMNINQSGYYLADKVNREVGYDPFASVANTISGIGDAMGFGGTEEKVRAIKPGEDMDSNLGNVWTDWILQSVQESRIEKTQVIETFGDSYFYAFWQRPRSIQFSGLLMNTTDYNWRAVFWKNWDEHFRATKLVEKGARLYIHWDDIIVEGYPINAVCSEVADSPNAMKFNFQLFVTRYINLAAQSGFLTQRYMRVAQLKAGSGLGMVDKTHGFRLMGGEDFDPRGFNYIRPSTGFFGSPDGGLFGAEGLLGLRTGTGAQYERFSVLGQLGPQAGNTVKRALLQIPGARGLAETTNLGASILRNAGYAVTALQKHAAINNRDPQKAKIFMSSFLRQLGRDVVQAGFQDVSDLLEDTMGVRRGEADQMIGYFMDVTNSMRNETRAGGKYKLSKFAQVSSVQAFARSIVNPSLHSGGTYPTRDAQGNTVLRGYGEQPGGIIAIDSAGNNVGDVDDIQFTSGSATGVIASDIDF